MLKKFYSLQTCFIILQCCGEILNDNKESISTIVSIADEVNQQLSPFRDLLEKFRNASDDKAGELKGEIIGGFKEIIKRAIMADELLKKEGQLENEKNFVNENTLLNMWRLLIDDYEESFPQPYEDDFEKKRVKFDNSKFVSLAQYDLIEERRRQKWLYYCMNPPNKKMSDLVDSLKKENVDFDSFSSGIAKAYRLLSDKFHSGFYKVIAGDPKRYFMFKNVVTAMRILLKQEDILDELVQKTIPDPSEKQNHT